MADALKNRGYRTGLVGKWHLGQCRSLLSNRARIWILSMDSVKGREAISSALTVKTNRPVPNGLKRMAQPVAFDGYLTDVFGQQAIEFLEDDTEEPFFLYLSFTAPHGPMHATEEDLERFKNITDKKKTYLRCNDLGNGPSHW